MSTRATTTARSRPACGNIYQLAAVLGVCFTFAAATAAQAGDLLRGGAPSGAIAGGRQAGARGASAAAARARASSNDALSRTTMALQSMKSMQASARALAKRGPGNLGINPNAPGLQLPNVPNGLAPGGLQVSPSVPVTLPDNGIPGVWVGAGLPTQRVVDGETIVTIEQEESKALLTWETFNIGEDTTLKFDQSAGGEDKGKWIVFNKVEDPSGVPSQILGSIKAPGQVYVINRNGIIFGGGSQINTRGFVASTLPINENLLGQGLLNNPDAQFLFSALAVPGGADGTPAFFPTTIDPEFTLSGGVNTYTLAESLAAGSTNRPLFTFRSSDGLTTALVENVDYTLSSDQRTATFTADGLAKIAETPVRVTYTPEAVRSGNITVQAGAVIRTPVSADGNGGRVMLVGANVTNAGRISTPAGQTILAAGQQVGVAAHASNDPSLRGLDVWVGAAGDGSGTVTNRGIIESLEGSVLMHGKAVNQSGAIESSTSVNLNGRIDLRASYGAVSNPNYDNPSASPNVGGGGPIFMYQHTGVVEVGEGSVTRILPDYLSLDTAPGLSLPESSQINLEGRAIHFRSNALMLAPSGDVNIRAGIWPYVDANGDRTVLGVGETGDPGLGNLLFAGGSQKFLFSSGQIYMDSTSTINVAGSTNVLVPLAQSILDVEFRGAEFADSPLQRNGILQTSLLTLDLRVSGIYGGRYWIGTPLGDATGLAGLIQRNVAQLTANGGTVTLRAGESIVVQQGATIDVSGGYYQHEGGLVETSRLLQYGRLVDVDAAVPNSIYDGIYTGQFARVSARWGIMETFAVPWMTGAHYEEGYIAGANGGVLDLTAPSMAIDGELLGKTVAGPRQRSAPPELSTLSFSFKAERLEPLLTDSFLTVSPTPPTVTFTSDVLLPEVTPFELTEFQEPLPIREERVSNFNISPDIFGENGFGHLAVENTDGDINIPSGVHLAVPARGSLALKGANITILGSITAPSGDLAFTVYNQSPEAVALFNAQGGSTLPPPAPNEDRGRFTLGAGASLSTAGLIVNDLPGSPNALTLPLATDGGSIAIQTYGASLAEGSTIDVSGGVKVGSDGAFSYGGGGDILIRTGRDVTLSRVIGGELALGSTLAGFSGATGGTLTLQASTIQIGGVATDPSTLWLSPDFFRQGGFTKYSLTGIGTAEISGVSIAPGTIIRPVSENWVATLIPGTQEVLLEATLNELGYRSPTSLSLTSSGFDDSSTGTVYEIIGHLVIPEDVRIVTDPGASVSLQGNTVTVLGSVIAPGGNIKVAGADRYPVGGTVVPEFAQATVYIGPEAVLSTAGTAVIVPDEFGRRLGTLYSGGVISVSGNIIAEAGGILDVSGSFSTFDVHPSSLGFTGSPIVPASSGLTQPLWKLLSVPTRVDSDGGFIDLTGSEMLFTDATLLGNAGGPTARGGTLSVASNRFAEGDATSADINLLVTAEGNTIASNNTELSVGSVVLDGAGVEMAGMGYFAVSRFNQGGFDSLDLGYKYFDTAQPGIGGNVQFEGPITINARSSLRIAAGGIVEASARVRLNAGYVAIGQEFQPPLNPEDPVDPLFPTLVGSSGGLPVAPTFGTGVLTINAGTIDLGTVSLQGIGQATLTAANGDIRGNGTFNIAGELTLRAAQVYPTTLSTLNIFAYDYEGGTGSVTILRSGQNEAPLSAGGTLNIFATDITQGGVLRAPMGSITLGWDGTDLDPSDADLDTPFDQVTQGSLDVPISAEVTLKSRSLTSVSGSGLLVPYGVSLDGSTWIDPSGVNVTVGGLPEKEVIIAGDSVTKQRGSIVDLSGGGDLYAFRWIPGPGGSADILGAASGDWSSSVEYDAGDLVMFGGQTWTARVGNSGEAPSIGMFWTLVPQSFAVLPGYQSAVAPYAPFNDSSTLGGEAGYISNSLQAGDQIYLNGIPGLAAGSYTLLPSRYALLPGAFLVTPTGNDTIGTVTLADGASYTSGVAFNEFSHGRQLSAVMSQFEVAPYEVVQNRVEFDNYAGNAFFTEAAARLNVDERQELPMDGGHVSFQGNSAIQLAGSILTDHVSFARGASVDISSFADIHVIGDSGTGPVGTGVVLSTSVLNSWGAESLLIGGIRRQTDEGTVVEVRAGTVELDNAGSTLVGSDIALAAKNELLVSEGSSITSTGRVRDVSPLLVFGDGALVRVSADPGATIVRVNRSASPAVTPLLSIGADVQLSGGSVILDSTHATQLDSTATLNTRSLALGSGRISIQLPGAVTDLSASQSLVLSGQILQDAQEVRSLTLTSYSTIDIYGSGEFGSEALRSLSLQSAGIVRGGDVTAGTVNIRAGNVLFANGSNVAQPTGAQATRAGSVQFDAEVIRFGENTFSIGGYENVVLNATGGILSRAKGNGADLVPTFSVAGNLTMNAPVITGSGGSTQQITAGGTLVLGQTDSPATVRGGLGSSLSFTGSEIVANGNVVLQSGEVTLRATSGDVTVGGTLDVTGTRREFFDLIRYSGGGNVTLTSDTGDVTLAAGSNVSVSALAEIDDGISGSAGSVHVNATNGVFDIDSGAILTGAAGVGKTSGTFLLDAGSLPDFEGLGDALNQGGFFEIRNLRVRTDDVVIEGTHVARNFAVSTDAGDIRVAGTGVIDASGDTGGRIALSAQGDLVLENGATLTVHAKEFSSAGKGGDIYLAAGAAIDGTANLGATLDIQTGSTVDLAVDSFNPGPLAQPGSSAFQGDFTGTLHLRAPRNLANNDLGIATIGGTITGASSILAEGYEVVDLTNSGGLITGSRASVTTLPSIGTMQRAVFDSAGSFLAAGNYDAMMQRILGSDSQGLLPAFVLAPGVEIINTNGDLTLGAAGSNSLTGDWSLADFRFGPRNAAGVLTLRATGDIVFNNSLSDGFTPVGPSTANGNSMLWLAEMSTLNPELPVNTQSWSFHIAAGADLAAADFHAVLPKEQLATGKGSLLLGEFYPAVPNTTTTGIGGTGTTANTIAIAGGGTRYEVIRTGTGDIDLAAAADVQLRNLFATIYSAGVRVPTATSIFAPGDFTAPVIPSTAQTHPAQGDLGAVQQPHTPQWSMAGGDVTISAESDIRRVTLLNGLLVDDSSRQLPNNWLYRRGYVDAASGLFGAVRVTGGLFPLNDPSASTTWWVDFTNFFQGVGALGGGDVTLLSGNNIVNVDAVVPTNARMASRDSNGLAIGPDAVNLLEFGGGDLTVRAGNNIDGGVYYVERGNGLLFAGGEITTNASRSPSLGILRDTDIITPGIQPDYLDPLTWLPTTLFVGKSFFDVSARGDILLGPVVNPFLLPQGLNNKFWYKTYFNTYSEDAGASVASFGGDVTHRLTTSNGSVLQVWLESQNRLIPNQTTPSTAGHFQPWIRLAESNPSLFQTLLNVNGPNLTSTAFAGDINVVGPMTLFPSTTGDLELAASGSIIGLNPVGLGSAPGLSGTFNKWASATINVSDADPSAIPGISSPLSFLQIIRDPNVSILRQTRPEVLAPINLFFQETGSYSGLAASSKVQQALHTDGLLHAADDQPIRLYAGEGDITGLTLFAPKATQIAAFRDISDVSFYIQNVSETDISFVSAGRDINPYNENAPTRSLANDLAAGNVVLDQFNPLAGDIQINGPGVLEVLAGRNLDLGSGSNFADGTGFGITSVGNARNPFLPFAGADLVVMAGVSGVGGSGPAFGLSGSSLDFEGFISEYQSDIESTESAYLAKVGANVRFDDLTAEQQALVALDTFYVLLRDSGRSASGAGATATEGDPAASDPAVAAPAPTDPASENSTGTTGGYEGGLAAIDILFGDTRRDGDILTQSREIRTRTGGAISLAAPGGGVAMASDIFGNPLTPPGVVTEFGGAVSIFTDASVEIGQARIFTLRGGDIVIWSSNGDIAAGNAPKTVVSAPPTRVVIDVNTATVQTDLGGLATGGGIGVLAAVEGIPPGNVDLIAPNGAVDAGDAGIRVTGNLNIAATTVLNASNIQTGGTSSGVPSAPPAAAPNLGAVGTSSTAAAGAAAANQVAQRGRDQEEEKREEAASVVVVEVIGYGGGEGGTPTSGGTEEDEEKRRKKQSEDQEKVQESELPQTN